MRLSRIDQHIKDEPCAKQRALLGVFSSRFSSVSRGVRSAVPIFSSLPLVLVVRISKVSIILEYREGALGKGFGHADYCNFVNF